MTVRMIKEGHIVGNHSATHPIFSEISRTEMAKEIETCDTSSFGFRHKCTDTRQCIQILKRFSEELKKSASLYSAKRTGLFRYIQKIVNRLSQII